MSSAQRLPTPSGSPVIHRRRALLILAIVAIFALAAASAARLRERGPQGTPSSVEGSEESPKHGALPPLSGLASCAQENATFKDQVACYRTILEPHLRDQGPRAILAELDALQGEHAVYRAHCHNMAHELGRLWVAHGRTIGAGFHEGSHTCHNGFYHGMLEPAFLEEAAYEGGIVHVAPDVIRPRVPGICTPEALGTESRRLQFQCLHGLGHAVVFATGYRLEVALDICDALPDAWDRTSCHGGAVMENITGVERDFRMLKRGDPHYPCSILKEQYRGSCYLMQTSWMLEDGMGWEEIIAACRAAGPHRLACFQSLGRDLSPRSRESGPRDYAPICARLPSEERSACVRGAVAALADHTTDGRYAYPFCAALEQADVRAECFRAAHGHLQGSLERTPEQLAADCRSTPARQEDCLTALDVSRPH